MTHAVTKQDMREMVEQGLSDQNIADRLGIKKAAAVKLRQRRGVIRGDTSRDYSKKTAEDLRKVEALLDEGYSFRAVSEITGITHRTIARHFPGRAFTEEQCVQARNMGRALAKVAA
ncbi:hypothetical protein SEA_PLATTE_71 [Microbacterium phage Platte]|nr:hypothetical protein SEA_TANDEM_71 [Microbacterium phage Tandem]QZD97663.1 hypothetical protein SEA_PLATTE_71 [Microbacterium phage Platte]